MSAIGKKKRSLKGICEVLQESPLTAVRHTLTDEMIIDACKDVGYKFRRRKYSPVCTVFHFLLQAIQREESFAATWAEMASAGIVAGGIDGFAFYSSSIAQARSRFPQAAFDSLLKTLCAVDTLSFDVWRGRRVVALDATTISMPGQKELLSHFGTGTGRGAAVRYPLGTLCALLTVGTSLIIDHRFGPYDPGELKTATPLLEAIGAGDLLLADRRFSGSPTMARILARGADFLMRKNPLLKVENLPVVERLGHNDFITEISMDKPVRRKDPSLPKKVRVRLVASWWKTSEGKVMKAWFVTSLTDRTVFKPRELARRYHDRWQIETSFREFKGLFHGDVLRSKTVDTIKKEMCAHVLAYQLIRLIIMEAARKHKKKPTHLSFLHAARWVCGFSRIMSVAPARRLPQMYEHLLDAIASSEIRIVPWRIERRVVMRVKKRFPQAKLPRLQWLTQRLKGVA
jgi:hypothetical protein